MTEFLIPGEERPIRREDEDKLRTMAQIGKHDPIPPEMRESYWRHARASQRLGYTIMPDACLISVVAHSATVSQLTDPALPWILRAVDSKQLKPDSKVKVRIGNAERTGKFMRLHQDRKRVRVEFPGEPGEQLVPVEDVIGAA